MTATHLATALVRRAVAGDLATICRLRVRRTAWLTARGSDQWTTRGRGLPIEVFARGVGRSLDAGETWIAEVNGEAAGTITVNHRADEGLWTRRELAESVIAHFLIVDLGFAGQRIGHRLLDHAAALARERDRSWVRLDAWTTNAGLHDYYRRAGFRLARIADTRSGGPSQALFERHAEHPPAHRLVTPPTPYPGDDDPLGPAHRN